MLYNVFNINMKMPNRFFSCEIVYFRRKCQIRLFFKVKIFFQNDRTNKNDVIKKLNKYNIC